jgi:hypothetical protein
MRMVDLTATGPRRTALVLLVVLVLAAVALGARALAGWPTSGNEPYVLAGDETFHFGTLPEMVSTSHAVFTGTVVGTARGIVIDEGEIKYTRKVVQIKTETVDKAVTGRPLGSVVTVETAGWRQVEGEAETELAIEGHIPLKISDRGRFFLYDFEHAGTYALVSGQGVLLYNGTEVIDTPRDDPLVRSLESMTVADVDAAVDQAVAAGAG